MARSKYIAVIAAVLLMSAASAQEAVHPQDEIAKMEAAIQVLNKRKDLRDAQSRISGLEALPYIVNIVSDGKVASAKVMYASGMTRTLHVGDFVIDGLQVTDITTSSVLVGGKKNKSSLPFLTRNTTPGTGVGSGFPVLPPIPGR